MEVARYIRAILWLALAALGSCTPKTSANYTLIRATYELPVTLDPTEVLSESSAAIIYQVFDGLTQVDTSLFVKPNLAKSWSVDDSGMTYNFTLRDDVWFHDGVRLTAERVVASLQRLLESQSQAKTALTNVRDVVADGSNRVVIHLTAPFPALLAVLAAPPAYIARYSSSNGGTFIGTGPFIPINKRDGSALTLTRNNRYHNEHIFFSSITYRKVEESDIIPALEKGLIHDASLFPSLSVPSTIGPRVSIKKVPSPNTWLLAVNLNNGAMQTLSARRCLFSIVPKRDIIEQLLPHHTPAGGYLAPGLPGYSGEFPAQGNGEVSICQEQRGLEVRMLYPRELPVTGSICAAFATSSSASNITIKCVASEFDRLLAEMNRGNYDLALLSITLDIPTPEYLFWTFEEGAEWKIAGKAAPRIQSLLSKARHTNNEKAQKLLYEQINKYIFENVLTINLSYPGHLSAYHSCLKHHDIGASGPAFLLLRSLRVDSDCGFIADFRSDQ